MTAAGRAAGSAILALSRVARSLALYDPTNAVVHQLLGEYRAKMQSALALGPISIDVRPTELVSGGEVVFRDEDREKSLAFKLYRDGVRRLEIPPHTPWEELLGLMEVLAVRTTGVLQQELDAVMLLRQADFKAIGFQAIEGYSPEEVNPEPALDPDVIEGAGPCNPPAGWDTPLPRLPQPQPVNFRAVPEAELEPLRVEAESTEAGADEKLALSVARDLLIESGRSGWPVPNPDLTAFLAELRDSLLAENKLGALRSLVDLLGEAGGGELRKEMLSTLGNARTLDLVMRNVEEGATRLPPELVPFLPLVGIEAALDRLAGEANDARRRLLIELVLARLPREAEVVLARLSAFEPAIVRDLARGLVQRVPERATEVARLLLGQKDEALRLEGVAALEAAPGEVPLRPVADLLRDPSGSVRKRAAVILGRRGDESVLPDLRRVLEEGEGISLEEAEEIGRALASLAPIAAAHLFAEWMEPHARFLRGLSARQRLLQWAAISGMGRLPGADPEPALNALAARSDAELKRHCLATLARRKKESHANGR